MPESKSLDFCHYKLVLQNKFEFLHVELCITLMAGTHLLAGIIDFKFLPIFTQGLHFAVFVTLSLCMYGHHAWVAISVITQGEWHVWLRRRHL